MARDYQIWKTDEAESEGRKSGPTLSVQHFQETPS